MFIKIFLLIYLYYLFYTISINHLYLIVCNEVSLVFERYSSCSFSNLSITTIEVIRLFERCKIYNSSKFSIYF